MATLQDTTKLSHNDLMQMVLALKAENEALKAKPQNKVSLKVSEKGAISVFGLQRFPVTLYASQWERIIAMADEIKAFIRENKTRLATKD